MIKWKPDADQIRSFWASLAEQDWVKRTERSWWPRFVFHYTDIRNAAKILQEGCLYSRKRLEDQGNLGISSGSASVLSDTNPVVKDYVRLYFRPLTPTQYYAEGIYSETTLARSNFPDAHCPVPVFFLFDSVKILARADCLFSNGNLASPRSRVFSSAAELEQLPWKKIYHTGRYNRYSMEESDIAFRRNAEVIIHHVLDLEALRYICCRSDAERETLLHLLPPNLQDHYQKKVIASTRITLFYRRQTFIETVQLAPKLAYVQFSPDTLSRGPFHLQVDLKGAFPPKTMVIKNFTLGPTDYRYKFPLPSVDYIIRITLDGHLAYASEYRDIELPF